MESFGYIVFQYAYLRDSLVKSANSYQTQILIKISNFLRSYQIMFTTMKEISKISLLTKWKFLSTPSQCINRSTIHQLKKTFQITMRTYSHLHITHLNKFLLCIFINSTISSKLRSMISFVALHTK